MSRTGVGMVIDKLLTDERLRIGFALHRMETIAELYLRGFELTAAEIDLFSRTDPRLWFFGAQLEANGTSEDGLASCGVPCLDDIGEGSNDHLH